MTQLWWFEKLGAAVIWTFWNGTISFFLDSAWLSSPWTQDVWWTWRLGAHILDCFLNVYNTIECILLRIVHRHLWFPKKHIHDDDMTPCWNMLKLCQYLGSLSKKTQRRTRCFCKPCSARLTHLGKRQPRSKSKPETLGLHDGYMMVTWVFPIVTFWWASIGLWNFLKLALNQITKYKSMGGFEYPK